MAAKILIVEDEAAIQELITYNLQRAGYETVCADHAEKAMMMINGFLISRKSNVLQTKLKNAELNSEKILDLKDFIREPQNYILVAWQSIWLIFAKSFARVHNSHM